VISSIVLGLWDVISKASKFYMKSEMYNTPNFRSSSSHSPAYLITRAKYVVLWVLYIELQCIAVKYYTRYFKLTVDREAYI